MESIANEGDHEGDCEDKLLKADGRKPLFEMCVTQEDKVIEEGLHRKTIIQGAGEIEWASSGRKQLHWFGGLLRLPY
ncbi:MAG TPA: hypothetical protein VEK32_22860 [Thermodesulfobacteriota bacterium]|nr:hypothetical protein [Thermodesulfobacteriota bacterium]